MASRSVLLAACVVARDPRVDAGALLDLWAREVPAQVNPLERTGDNACAAVVDDLDQQAFLLAAWRGTRSGLAVGCHLGTRVNGRRDEDPVSVSARSIEAARQLALAAGDGQIVLSDDLGAFLSIARARLAPNLESTRIRARGGPDVAAYRLRATPVAAASPRNGLAAPTALDEGRRSRLFDRLGAALTPYLGPIAPLMLEQLPRGRLSSQELVEAILRNVPAAQHEPVKRLIEDEIRAVR